MGFLGTWIFCSLPFDILILLMNPSGETSDLVSKTLFFVSLVITFIGFLQARRGPIVNHIPLQIENGKDDLKNFKIVQISDLHVGLTIRKKYVADVVEKVLAANPDIIVITGDIADGSPSKLEKDLEPLLRLKARYGIYFITGNHEYYSGAQQWIDYVKSIGIIPLLNENRIIKIGASKLLVAGVTDFTGGQFIASHHPDFIKARGDDAADFKVLLAHQPESHKYIQNLDFDLLLSGHTHAGQFFPFNLLVHFVHKHNKGLSREGKLWIYVNQGTGYWGPAHRFFVPSEISVIEL